MGFLRLVGAVALIAVAARRRRRRRRAAQAAAAELEETVDQNMNMNMMNMKELAMVPQKEEIGDGEAEIPVPPASGPEQAVPPLAERVPAEEEDEFEDKENVAPVPEELLRIEALFLSGKKPSWREVLGVGPSVPHKAVTSAYRKVSLMVHADKLHGHDLKDRATRVMKEVNLAKEMADEEQELGTAGIAGLRPDWYAASNGFDFSGRNEYGPDHESWESADPEDARRRKEEEKQADEWTERMRAKAKERAQWREAGGAAEQKEAEDPEYDELFDEILRECQM